MRRSGADDYRGGLSDGVEIGFGAGLVTGFGIGARYGHRVGYNKGYRDGKQTSFECGYAMGYYDACNGHEFSPQGAHLRWQQAGEPELKKILSRIESNLPPVPEPIPRRVVTELQLGEVVKTPSLRLDRSNFPTRTFDATNVAGSAKAIDVLPKFKPTVVDSVVEPVRFPEKQDFEARHLAEMNRKQAMREAHEATASIRLAEAKRASDSTNWRERDWERRRKASQEEFAARMSAKKREEERIWNIVHADTERRLEKQRRDWVEDRQWIAVAAAKERASDSSQLEDEKERLAEREKRLDERERRLRDRELSLATKVPVRPLQSSWTPTRQFTFGKGYCSLPKDVV